MRSVSGESAMLRIAPMMPRWIQSLLLPERHARKAARPESRSWVFRWVVGVGDRGGGAVWV